MPERRLEWKVTPCFCPEQLGGAGAVADEGLGGMLSLRQVPVGERLGHRRRSEGCLQAPVCTLGRAGGWAV